MLHFSNKYAEDEYAFLVNTAGIDPKHLHYYVVSWNVDACLDDHLALLKKPMYADAWPYRGDAKEYARRLVDNTGAKYATAPNYAAIMASVIDTVANIVKSL